MKYSQRAVLALTVGSFVEIKEIGVEEVADLGRSTILRSSGKIVLVLSLAVSGTERCVEWTCREDTASHKSVIALVIERCVDSSVVEVLNITEACRHFEGLVHVTVGTSDGDLELVAPLTIVIGIGRRHRASPEYTLLNDQRWSEKERKNIYLDDGG